MTRGDDEPRGGRHQLRSDTPRSIEAVLDRRFLKQPIPYGRFLLLAKLGHGGMAEVFLAYPRRASSDRRLCVVKRLHAELEEEPGFVAMFMDEARLAARIGHPNVVQTFEVDQVDGTHYIAMEYLEGQGLDRIRTACGRAERHVPPLIAARIAMEALDGLHHAHELTDAGGVQQGVIHRDVSPQNVFVTYDGQVKLLDFGIAKAASNVVQTAADMLKGKASYMAPEQARGETLDRRVDLWSMGVVLWEVLTRQRLFRGATDVVALTSTLGRRIPRVSETVPDLPAALDETVSRALQRDPKVRYGTAAEMAGDLRRLLADEAPGLGPVDVARFMAELFSEEIALDRFMVRLSLDAANGRDV